MSGRVFVEVNVCMRHAVVFVLVYVDLAVGPQNAPKRADSQTNDHESDAEFQPGAYVFRDGDPQRQHDHGDDEQRCRVAQAPKPADHRGMENTLVPAHDRGDRYDVIDLRGVFQAKDQADA